MKSSSVATGIFLTAAVIGMVFALKAYLDLPVVMTGDLDGKCLDVIDPAALRESRKAYTCDALPPRYERVVVAQKGLKN